MNTEVTGELSENTEIMRNYAKQKMGSVLCWFIVLVYCIVFAGVIVIGYDGGMLVGKIWGNIWDNAC